ncbi:helix-hairpin-helix domain-containing protein [Thermosyntropha sp.]|uniref:helix-hairpin-helix domain-containing protein n=1 Tax=Thermosyntropha sp. TaxID=2740820 RepID=UPI0025DD0834|nr:helix-hairpin-helix domain-containing protein [Thermosyntropha sp.]MBO8158698.1 helix-hairpin-helix domain-containing protein [Thermosyntropha sp.]
MQINRRFLTVFFVTLLFAFWGGIKYADLKFQNVSEVIKLNENADLKDSLNNKEENKYIQVYVGGQVVKPGVYKLLYGARVYEAVEEAGGVLETADLKYIPMAKKLEDEETVWIPSYDETAAIKDTPSYNYPGFNSNLVNINTASVEELAEKLNGIGPALAQRIVDYRTQNGKFKSVEDIKNVSGIGEKRFEQLKDQICIK